MELSLLRVAPYQFSDTTLVSSSVPETDHAAWSAATAYTLGQRVIRTQTHRVYEALAAVGPSATLPENDPDHWLDLEATNRWKPFDYYNSRRFSAVDAQWVWEPDQAVDTLLISKTECASVTVHVEYDGIIFQNDTFDMFVMDYTDDFYTWIFGVPEPILDRAIQLDTIPGATITATLNGAGIIGTVLVGWADDWGITGWDTSLTFRDMSRPEEDDFGIKSVTRRPGFFDINFRVAIPPGQVPRVKRLVREGSGTVAGYLGTQEAVYGSMVIGVLRSFDLDYANPGISNYTLTVRGTV